MNRVENNDRMLDDVLHDEAFQALKESIRRNCRMEMARKRRFRHAWWIAPVVVAALIFLVFKIIPMPESVAPVPLPPVKPYYVTTQPLPPDKEVHTRPSSVMITSDPRIQVTIITDDEMLDLFPDIPRGLIQTQDQQKRLVFLNPEDEERIVVTFPSSVSSP